MCAGRFKRCQIFKELGSTTKAEAKQHLFTSYRPAAHIQEECGLAGSNRGLMLLISYAPTHAHSGSHTSGGGREACSANDTGTRQVMCQFLNNGCSRVADRHRRRENLWSGAAVSGEPLRMRVETVDETSLLTAYSLGIRRPCTPTRHHPP